MQASDNRCPDLELDEDLDRAYFDRGLRSPSRRIAMGKKPGYGGGKSGGTKKR